MTEITNEYMQEMMTKTKNYTTVILKTGPNFNMDGARNIIWEHGRNNFRLRAEGKLSIVCPIPTTAGTCGLGIFNCSEEETRKLMEEDPAIKENVLLFEVYNCRSFPGDSLP